MNYTRFLSQPVHMDGVRQENTALWVVPFRVLYSAGYIGPVRNEEVNSFKYLPLGQNMQRNCIRTKRNTINRNFEMLDVASRSQEKQKLRLCGNIL
jgi:hypothetical protein